MRCGDKTMLPLLEKAASILGLSQKREQPRGTEARRHQRFPANETARVYWKDADGIDQDMEVMVVNVSVSGMAFLSTVAFEKGAWITVKTAKRTLDAVVRHARAVESSYAIGVEVFPAAGSALQQSLRRLSVALSDRTRS